MQNLHELFPRFHPTHPGKHVASCASCTASCLCDRLASYSTTNTSPSLGPRSHSHHSIPSPRPKRSRTSFTPAQLERLEEDFCVDMYVVGLKRMKLANELNLSERQVKVWFQNRRMKYKRERSKMCSPLNKWKQQCLQIPGYQKKTKNARLATSSLLACGVIWNFVLELTTFLEQLSKMATKRLVPTAGVKNNDYNEYQWTRRPYTFCFIYHVAKCHCRFTTALCFL